MIKVTVTLLHTAIGLFTGCLKKNIIHNFAMFARSLEIIDQAFKIFAIKFDRSDSLRCVWIIQKWHKLLLMLQIYKTGVLFIPWCCDPDSCSLTDGSVCIYLHVFSLPSALDIH